MNTLILHIFPFDTETRFGLEIFQKLLIDEIQNWFPTREEKNSFEKVVKTAISLGDDTDTTACIAGGIAGLKFSINGIPERWKDNLRGKEIYEPMLEKLLERF